jgi:putative Holliday junction resolvase
VALSDPTATFASPNRVVTCTGRRNDLARLKEIVESTGAEQVVVGMPTTLRGEQGLAAQQAEEFARQLAAEIDVPVTTWDERMTTVVAERALVAAGERRETRRDKRDKVAAAVMLQSYLDAQSRG